MQRSPSDWNVFRGVSWVPFARLTEFARRMASPAARRKLLVAGLHRAAVVAAIVATLVGTAPSTAMAADFYWDPDGNPAGNNVNGTGLGGSGTWDTSSLLWWDLTNDVAWPNTTADRAFFTGPATVLPTPYTVTVDPGIIANQLRFLRSGYTLSGGNITLGGSGAGLFANLAESATIGSQILGTSGLTMTGGGAIRLTNASNAYTGTTTISHGSLVITNQAALGTDTSAVVVTGNALRGFGGGSLVLDGTGGTVTISRNLNLTGHGPISDRSAALISVGNNTLSGTVDMGGTFAGLNRSTRITSAGGTLTLSGTLNVQGTAGTTISSLGGTNQGGANNYELTGALTGTGTLEKTGGGTLFLNPSASSGFSGVIRMSGSVTGGQSSVRITSPGVLGTRTAAGTGGVLDMNTGLLEIRMDSPSVLAGGAPANMYARGNSSTLFADHAPGSSVINGTVTFGQLAHDAAMTLTFNSRNGYGMTFGASPIQANAGNSTLTNNMGGDLTFTGTFWSQANNAAARTMTIGGSGNTVIAGNVTASAAAFDHALTKTGAGSLTITSTGATLDGSVNIQGGAIRITDFRSLNMHSGGTNTGTLTVGTGTTAGALIIGTTTTPTALGLTMARPIDLAGTTGAPSIYANQPGTNPVSIGTTITASGAGIKTLTLGGTSTVNNIISSVIPNNSVTHTTALAKIGPGTWVLGGVNTYTGATTLGEGTLKLNANAATSTIIADTSPITFNTVANGFSGATLEFVGQPSTSNVETLGQLTLTTGANTIKLTPGTGGNASLVFESLNATIGDGGTLNIVGSTGSSTVTLTGVPTGLVSPHFFFGGSHFARSNSGVLVAPVYGTDATFVTAPGGTALPAGVDNFNITGNITAQPTQQVQTLRFDGGQTLTLQAGATLMVRTGAAGTDGGLLATGGASTITGGTGVTTGGAGALIIRVDGATDSLNLNTVLTAGTTGGITKSGAGTLTLSAANLQTGLFTINEGTVRLATGGQLGPNATSLTIRQGGVFDLNGITQSTTIGALNNAGTLTSASPAAITVGGGNLTGTSYGVVTGAVSLTKIGTGGQSWLGDSTYTGVTTIGSTGLVTVDRLADGGQPSGIGASSSAASNLVFNGSTGGLVYQGNIVDGALVLGSRSASTDRLFTLAGTGATLSSTATNGNAIVWSNTGAIAHGVVGPQTLILTGTSTGDNTFNPQLTDSGTGTNITGLTKTGAGQWNLGNSNNTYTGITAVQDGILGINAAGALAPNSPLVLGNAATNGVLQLSGNFERNLAATPTAGLGTVSWGAITTGGGGFAAHTTKLTVAIGGISTPTALTWGSGGFVPAGGSLILGSGSSLAETEFRNPIDLNGAVRTINVLDNTNTGADFATVSGVLSGTGTSGVSKAGAGILTLTGANTYTGNTAVVGGTLRVTSLGSSTGGPSSSVGAGGVTMTNANAVTLGNGTTVGGILQYIGPGETSDRKIRLNTTTAANQIHADGAGPIVLTNVANDMGSGAKTLFLRGSNTAGNMITSVLANNGGALAITVDGGATWILSGANTYTGNTNVNTGVLGIGDNSALGTGTLSLSSGNLFAYGADRTVANAVTHVNNTTQGYIGDYSLTFTGTKDLAAGANNVGSNNNIAAGKALTFGNITANAMTANRTWTIDGSGTTIVTGNITTSTAFGLLIVKNGDGTLQLNGTGSNFNQNSANIDLDRGVLRVGADEVIPHGAGFGNLLITPEAATSDIATFDLNGFTETINGLTATTDGTVVIDNTASTNAVFRFGANDAVVNFGSGTGSYTITDSGTGNLSIVKLGNTTATFNPGVVLTYQGATRVEGGTLNITGAVNGTTALEVMSAAAPTALNLTGGITVPSAVTSVVVQDNATLNLLDGTGNKLTSLLNLQLGSAGGTNSTLTFNVGDSVTPGDQLHTDRLQLVTGGTLSLFTGNTITFNINDAGLNPLTQYVLLDATAIGGGFFGGSSPHPTIASYILGTVPGGFTSIDLTTNSTTNQIILTTGNLILGDLFWRGAAGGGTDNTWNANPNNWSQDKANTLVATSIPGAGTNVVFAINSASGAVTTTLEQNFKINSLVFEAGTSTPTSVSIGPGANPANRLEISPSSPANGVAITTGGPPTVTISAPLRVSAPQTWNIVDAASLLTLSGGLQGEADVTKSGTGRVVVSAAADPGFNSGGTADFFVNGGTLEIQNVSALGVAPNQAAVAINTGGAFYYNAATATIGNPLTLGGGALSAGTAAQTYSGPVNVSANSIINMADSNGPPTATARNITLSGVVSGAGNLTINSQNTVTAGNQLTGTLLINNGGTTWSGGLLMDRGTVTIAPAVSPVFTNNVAFNQFGRVIVQGVNGGVLTRTGTLTYAAGSIGEFQVDNTSGTLTSNYTVIQSGLTTIGAGAGVRFFLQDTASALDVGNVSLGGTASISVGGGDADSFVTISGVISDGGGGFGLNINDDLGGWAVANTILRLTGANTFTGNISLDSGTLEYTTVTNISGGPSSLGNGTAINTTAAATLRFVGTSPQATDRPITTAGGALTLSANGATAADTITYNGLITIGPTADGSQIVLTGAAGRHGILAGGLVQTGDAADMTVNGGTWTHMTATTSRIGDDVTLTGASTILNLNSGLLSVRDDFIVTAGATLNLNGTGVLSFNTPTLSADASLLLRDGAVVNLGADNAVVATEFDRLFLSQDAGGATTTLNMNTFNLTTSRLYLGERLADRVGVINGTGTLTVAGGDIDLYRGTIHANLASTGTIALEKFGPGLVTLLGNNSGLASTGASIVYEGTLALDYSASNTTKLRAASALDMRGSDLVLDGNSSAGTSQSVGSFTLANGGSSKITLNPGGSQPIVLNLNAITRVVNSQDGTVRFNLPSGTQNATNGITTDALNTVGTGTHAILGGWATVNDGTGVFFARNLTNLADGNIVAAVTTVQDAVGSWGLNENISDSTGFTGTVSRFNINSLRFDAASGSDLDIAAGGVLGITSGGVLVTSNAGGTPSIMGGTLASGAVAATPELIFTQDSASVFEAGSDIRVNHIVFKTGPGTLRLSGNNVYTGATEIQEGTLQVSGGRAIGDLSLVTLASSRDTTLQLLADETIGRLAGGQRAANSDYGTVAIGAHTLTINQSASTTYAGFFTGTGSLVMNAGNTGNLNLTNVSSGFTGSVEISGGLFQLSGIGQINASSFTINKGGNLLIDNNTATRSGTRILDTASITLHSADGTFSGQTRPRGLAIRTDQDATLHETVGVVTAASGASYASLEATTANDDSDIIMNNLLRTNNATLNVRGTNLGTTVAQRNQFRIGDATNQTAFIGTLVGGGGGAGTQNISIVPWAIGETFTAGLADANMGNSLVTYVAGPGIRPLDFTTEYDTLALAAPTENVRESLTADLTGIVGTTINALVIHNNNTAASTINVTGAGAGHTLAVTSGAMLFTLNPTATTSSAHAVNLGGFDSGITVGGTNEYVIHVVNPSSVADTPTLAVNISSALTTAADITKSGRGTLILSGLNTAGGAARKTTINEGVLQIGDLDNIGGDTGELVFAGGVLRLGSGFVDDLSTRTISYLPGGGTLDTNGISLSLANSLGSGAGGFTKIGAGTLTLNASASYTGPTTLTTGTIDVNANNALGVGGNLSLGGGTTLNVNTFSIAHGLVTTSGASPLITGTGTITASEGFFFNHTGSTSIGAVLAGAGGLVKAQTNTVTLSGLNTYTGVTEVQAGVLSFDSIANVGGGPSALGAPTTAAAGVIRMGLLTNATTLNYTGSGHSSDRFVALQGSTGGVTIDADGTGALVLGGAQGEMAGAKTLTLQGSSAPTLVNSIGPIADGAGTISVNKIEGNTWAITGASTYTGNTTAGGGVLRAAHNQAFGTVGSVTLENTDAVLELADGITISNPLTISNTGDNKVLRLQSGATSGTYAGGITINETTFGFFDVHTELMGSLEISGIISGTAAGGVTKTGPGTVALTAANTYTGATAVSGGTLRLGNGGATGSLNTGSAISIGSGATFAVNRNNTVTQGTDFSGAALTGAGGFAQIGTGTTILNAANTFSGGVTIAAGTLSVGADNNLGAASNDIDFTGNNATLAVTSSFSSSRDLNLNMSSATHNAVLNVAALQTFTAAGTITGSGGIIKSGTGRLDLTNTAAGSYDFDGGVTINSGRLHVGAGVTLDSDLGVVVNSGGTLSGSGTIDDQVTINSGGTLSPGSSPGTLSVTGPLVWNGGSSHVFDVTNIAGTPGTDWDQILVTDPINGILTINATAINPATIVLNPGLNPITGFDKTTLTPYTWLWVTATAGINLTGSDPIGSRFVFDDTGVFGPGAPHTPNTHLGTFYVTQVSNQLFINYVAIPEPGSMILLGLAGLGMGAYGWRRRKRAEQAGSGEQSAADEAAPAAEDQQA